jgi:hypothetical protein
MADISLQLDTTQYPLAIVDGTTLTLSLNGAAGPSGPNTVTTNTLTDLNGYIYGDGTNIIGATDASNANIGDTLVMRDADGNFNGNIITAEESLSTTGDIIAYNLALSNGSYYNQLRSTTLTATRIITLPNLSGNIALMNASQSWSGTQTFTGAFEVSNSSLKLSTTLPVYADNYAASSLSAGTVYRTSSGQLMIRY